jgi:hypothetical protein
MEMEQMMARRLSDTRTNREEMRFDQEHLKQMLTKVETDQEKTVAMLDAHYERVMAGMDHRVEEMEAADNIFD